jgi:hypothetical protein
MGHNDRRNEVLPILIEPQMGKKIPVDVVDRESGKITSNEVFKDQPVNELAFSWSPKSIR